MPDSVAAVTLWGLPIGAVVWDGSKEVALFEYTPEFLSTGFEVAPIMMPASPGTKSFTHLNKETYSGLPGLLADSLPDKFGRAIINDWLARQGRKPNSLNPVERLCYVGTRGMGALEFTPSTDLGDDVDVDIDVKELVELSSAILSDHQDRKAVLDDKMTDETMRRVVMVGTSAGGARAKAIIGWNEATGEVRSGHLKLKPGFTHWIMKLDGISNNKDKEASSDPEGYGIREYLYYLMAKDAGIEMSESRLFRENGRSHFMTRRFDRTDDGEKVMMQSLCAMGHYDFNQPGSCSYDQLFVLLKDMGLGKKAVEEQFRRMVFCVLGCNRDDHTKNVAFLMDKQGEWSLSPAYDMTFAYNPTGEFTNGHQMLVNGKRDGITLSDLHEVGKRAGLKTPTIKSIIEQVDGALAQWPTLVSHEKLDQKLAWVTSQNLEEMRSAVLG